MKTIHSFRIDSELIEDLKTIAEREDRTLSDIIRRALTLYIMRMK